MARELFLIFEEDRHDFLGAGIDFAGEVHRAMRALAEEETRTSLSSATTRERLTYLEHCVTFVGRFGSQSTLGAVVGTLRLNGVPTPLIPDLIELLRKQAAPALLERVPSTLCQELLLSSRQYCDSRQGERPTSGVVNLVGLYLKGWLESISYLQ